MTGRYGIRGYGIRGVALGTLALLMSAASLLPGFGEGGLAANAQERPGIKNTPALVTFGPKALRAEGDHDFRQLIRFSLSHDAGPVYVRVFDPDVGGAHDEGVSGVGGRTRFSLFGDGATTRLWRDEEGIVQESIEGEPLGSVEYGSDPETDGKWASLFEVEPDQGAPTGDLREFVLLVEGTGGNDGNVFEVDISRSPDSEDTPDGLKIYSYMPTFQVSRKGTFVELGFPIPPAAKSLVVENYDSAGGHVAYAGRFRTVPLQASRKSEWSRSTVELMPDEPGRMGSVTMAEGGETPNDVTVFVGAPTNSDDAVEAPVAIQLPLRVFSAYPRPVAGYRLDPGACNVMGFDASSSVDPRGGPLTHDWFINDATRARSGAEISGNFEAPGDYPARLEVFNDSGQIASGSATDFSFYVKPPPVAVLKAPDLVAQGAEVAFDGTGSSTVARPDGNHISRYLWRMGDGGEIVQKEGDPDFGRPVHVYRDYGVYTVELTVFDSAGNPCDSATVTQQIAVNAKPVAETGGDRRIAFGETIAFDAGDPTGPDGDTHRFSWDFGDGKTATGPQVEHRYGAPGTYDVTLVVDDGKGAENSVSTDHASVFVNAAPDGSLVVVPERMDPRVPALFDASRAFDSDGSITSIKWTFSDGMTTDKSAFKRSFREPGEYQVTLALTDDSGLSNAVNEITWTIFVPDPGNMPPVADAGGDREATVGEIVRFDGSASHDDDGSILAYAWDFGDGQRASRESVDHAYHKPGTYTVTLEVTDNSERDNAIGKTSFDITVTNPDNASPIVPAGGDRSAFVDEIIEFDASASVDTDGNLLSVNWDFGDGGVASGLKAYHSYREPGEYPVSVIVSDDSDLRGAVTAKRFTVTVTDKPNEAPVADIPAELDLFTEIPHVFDASGAGDPDGTITRYLWDFGDGASSYRPVTDHVYAEPGTYNGTLKLTDNSGLENGISVLGFVVHVTERPNVQPVAEAGGDVEAIVGQRIDFDGSASTDEDSSLIDYHWDFGNGKTATGEKRSIAYFHPGTYTVTLTVTDNSGQENASASDTLTVTVLDRPNEAPVARAPADRPAAIDEPVRFSADEFGGSGRKHPGLRMGFR